MWELHYFLRSTPDFSVAEHYSLRNTTCLFSKDIASEDSAFIWRSRNLDVQQIQQQIVLQKKNFLKKVKSQETQPVGVYVHPQ
jgi:hypothetical protein